MIEIQRRLPNARVLYVSATGATESSNLGYMQRLGLWGVGTAFKSRTQFVNLLDQRGVGELPPADLGPCHRVPTTALKMMWWNAWLRAVWNPLAGNGSANDPWRVHVSR